LKEAALVPQKVKYQMDLLQNQMDIKMNNLNTKIETNIKEMGDYITSLHSEVS